MPRHRKLWALFLLLGLSVPVRAQTPPTVADLLSVRTISDLRLSPDGNDLAFVVRSADREDNVFRYRLYRSGTGAAAEARPLTRPSLRVRSPRWSPTGTYLAFLAPAPKDDDEDTAPQVWILPAEGGEARVLTRAPEGVRAFAWTPDGQALVYLSREPRPDALAAWRERREDDGNDARRVHGDRRPMVLWRIDLDGGAPVRLYRGDAGIRTFALSPDGRRAAFTTNYTGLADDPTDLWIADLEAGTARRLTRRPGNERSPRFAPDGRRVAFLATRDPDIYYSQTDIFLLSLTDGRTTNLTADFDRQVVDFAWPDRADQLLFTAAVGTNQHLYRLDPVDGGVERVVGGDRVVGAFAASTDGDALFAAVRTPSALPGVYRIEGGDRLRSVTALNDRLSTRGWARQEVVRWTSPDGTAVEGVLTYPDTEPPAEGYPLVVDIHGGPHARVVNALPGRGFAQLWAARGYLVLQPNYRGSAGYGEAFGTANRNDLAGGDYRDILAGVDTLVAAGLVDPDRMGVTGGSYGGYMTNWIISQTDRFAAAVSLYGIFSLVTDFSNSTIPSWEREHLGAYYWDDPTLYRERSPMSYVERITTPVLILHGAADDNTRPANSREMYQAFRLLGRDVEFVLYPREGHGISAEPAHVEDKWARMRRWFDEWILYRGVADRLYEVGDSVPAVGEGPEAADAWTLRVTGVRPGRRYTGVDGRFLEVEMLLLGPAEADGWPLTLTGSDGDVVLERDGATSVVPVGVPVSHGGAAALVTGPGQWVRVGGGKGGATALAVALAFPLPAPGTWRLRVGPFAPVVIRVPAEDGAVATVRVQAAPKVVAGAAPQQ